MSGGVIVPIMAMDLVKRYVSNPSIKNQLSEFDFIWAVGQIVKDKGCYCGINQQVANITPQFNAIVENLTPELVSKISNVLGRQPLCFGILKGHKFETKCY